MFKSLGKNQRIRVSAGQCNTLHRKLCCPEQLHCLMYPVICQKLLWRHAKRVLKQGIQITPVHTHIIRYVRDLEGITVIAADIGNCSFHVMICTIQFSMLLRRNTIRNQGKKHLKLSVPAKFIGNPIGIVLYHILNRLI